MMEKYTLDKLIVKKDMDMELMFIKMEKFIKECLSIMKKMVKVYRYIQMETSIQDNFKLIKNMDMDNFFGLIFLLKIQKKMIMFSIIKAIGGVVFLMDKEFIKK